ncbi:MAG: hypothetical protein GWP09_02525 [Nitrospiraceae bacterium]|nr:hypothetical protein [Nitrospiraceae bacterium]
MLNNIIKLFKRKDRTISNPTNINSKSPTETTKSKRNSEFIKQNLEQKVDEIIPNEEITKKPLGLVFNISNQIWFLPDINFDRESPYTLEDCRPVSTLKSYDNMSEISFLELKDNLYTSFESKFFFSDEERQNVVGITTPFKEYVKTIDDKLISSPKLRKIHIEDEEKPILLTEYSPTVLDLKGYPLIHYKDVEDNNISEIDDIIENNNSVYLVTTSLNKSIIKVFSTEYDKDTALLRIKDEKHRLNTSFLVSYKDFQAYKTSVNDISWLFMADYSFYLQNNQIDELNIYNIEKKHPLNEGAKLYNHYEVLREYTNGKNHYLDILIGINNNKKLMLYQLDISNTKKPKLLKIKDFLTGLGAQKGYYFKPIRNEKVYSKLNFISAF